MSEKSDGKQTLYCSFCGKAQYEVRKLIAGPAVFICNECADLCFEIIHFEPSITIRSAKAIMVALGEPRVDESFGDYFRRICSAAQQEPSPEERRNTLLRAKQQRQEELDKLRAQHEARLAAAESELQEYEAQFRVAAREIEEQLAEIG